MPKDWKIGLVTGFILASLGAIWFSTNPQSNYKTASLDENREAVFLNEAVKAEKKVSVSNELSETLTGAAPLRLVASEEVKIAVKPEPLPEKADKLYTVEKGDSLSLIAEKVYSDKAMWHKIRDANKIKNVNALRPGMELIIP